MVNRRSAHVQSPAETSMRTGFLLPTSAAHGESASRDIGARQAIQVAGASLRYANGLYRYQEGRGTGREHGRPRWSNGACTLLFARPNTGEPLFCALPKSRGWMIQCVSEPNVTASAATSSSGSASRTRDGRNTSMLLMPRYHSACGPHASDLLECAFSSPHVHERSRSRALSGASARIMTTSTRGALLTPNAQSPAALRDVPTVSLYHSTAVISAPYPPHTIARTRPR